MTKNIIEKLLKVALNTKQYRDEVNLLHSITKWYSFSISNLHIGQSLFSKGIFW
jgi:hypothetical protein